MIQSLDIQYDYEVSVIDPISSENLFISRRKEEKKKYMKMLKQNSILIKLRIYYKRRMRWIELFVCVPCAWISISILKPTTLTFDSIDISRFVWKCNAIVRAKLFSRKPLQVLRDARVKMCIHFKPSTKKKTIFVSSIWHIRAEHLVLMLIFIRLIQSHRLSDT